MAAEVTKNDTETGEDDKKVHLQVSTDHVATIDGQDNEGGDQTSSEKRRPNGESKKPERRDQRGGGKRKQKGRKEPKAAAQAQRGDEDPPQWRESKRRKLDIANAGPSYMNIPFTAEEIAVEERRPKRKVAVMIGYAGTGYHGLQINHKDKTIEGELFAAFIDAGAISKANANDPQKSKLVRCARTDRGVHAAGNVLSLNLIIEDQDLVQKLNDRLPPQIRVWGIQRTNNKFSSHQACDSRWYEYLMPSYCVLPPHPYSYLAKKAHEAATEKGVLEEYMSRLGDVRDFWNLVDSVDVKPILDGLSPETRSEVLSALRAEGSVQEFSTGQKEDGDQTDAPANEGKPSGQEGAASAEDGGTAAVNPTPEITYQKPMAPTELAVREVKAAWMKAKRRYRISPERIKHFQGMLDQFIGTKNFHNFTIEKAFKDPSAIRHIKSFVLNPTPIIQGDTEWLSLKVHGQSFMMHQIRKMVAMAAMLTRTGAPPDRITQSYGPRRISVPKAPGLGLLLERPVFENYNRRATEQLAKDAIDFAQYEKEIAEFKDREIYRRMFETEERINTFHIFFNQMDNFNTNYFLWCTAAGLDGAYERYGRGMVDKVPKGLEEELGDEGEEGGSTNPEDGEG